VVHPDQEIAPEKGRAMTHRMPLPLSRRSVRRVLGGIWLLDAALQAQPVMFSADWWRADLAGSAMGEPGWVAHPILWASGLVAAHVGPWNALFVAVQALIGLALITNRGARIAVLVSAPWAIGIWWIGEGLGMLPTGFAMAAAGAPGPVLLYPLIGVLAWPGARDKEPVTGRAAVVAWVVLWAGQAVLQAPFVYPSRQMLTANIQELSQGLPRWQGSVADWIGGLASSHPVAMSVVLVLVQMAVGLGILSRSARGPALVIGIAVSLFYWVCFQYLGSITVAGATDPDAAPLMILLALAMWPAATAGVGGGAVARLGRPFSVNASSPALQIP
jgi:hypothetical protein